MSPGGGRSEASRDGTGDGGGSGGEAGRQTRRRYDRIAPIYDVMEAGIERLLYTRWRERLWSNARGRVLELGVGTGANLPHHPDGARVVAGDLSPRMLERARRRARRLGSDVELLRLDAEALPFPAASFDTVVATFVFCSVPHPVRGLREARKTLKPGGRLLLLEHVRSSGPWLGRLMDRLNPIAVRLTGANIDRDAVANVERAGFEVERVDTLSPAGIYKLIAATPARP